MSGKNVNLTTHFNYISCFRWCVPFYSLWPSCWLVQDSQQAIRNSQIIGSKRQHREPSGAHHLKEYRNRADKRFQILCCIFLDSLRCLRCSALHILHAVEMMPFMEYDLYTYIRSDGFYFWTCERLKSWGRLLIDGVYSLCLIK